jgi:hypothetical protein
MLSKSLKIAQKIFEPLRRGERQASVQTALCSFVSSLLCVTLFKKFFGLTDKKRRREK